MFSLGHTKYGHVGLKHIWYVGRQFILFEERNKQKEKKRIF